MALRVPKSSTPGPAREENTFATGWLIGARHISDQSTPCSKTVRSVLWFQAVGLKVASPDALKRQRAVEVERMFQLKHPQL